MSEDYIQRARVATQKRYAAQASHARDLQAIRDRLHSAHDSGAPVGDATASATGGGSAPAGPSNLQALSLPECVAVDLDNLSVIASRSGKSSAAAHKGNMAVLIAAHQLRAAGKSSSAAKLWAAAASSGGVPAPPPDVDRAGGRGALEAGGDPLRQIQRTLSAQSAVKSASRARDLAASPVQLRAPVSHGGSRLAVNGVAQTMEISGGVAPPDGSVDEVSGSRYRGVVDQDGAGVFNLFQDDYQPKTDEIYLSLARTVMVEQRLSGWVVMDETTTIAELVGLFSPSMRDANLWSFGHKKSLETFFRRCRFAR